MATKPPRRYASSISSKESAEISTPAPNDITVAMARWGTSKRKATAAPTRRAAPATKPQNPAASQVGMSSPLRSHRTIRRSQSVRAAGKSHAGDRHAGRVPAATHTSAGATRPAEVSKPRRRSATSAQAADRTASERSATTAR